MLNNVELLTKYYVEMFYEMFKTIFFFLKKLSRKKMNKLNVISSFKNMNLYSIFYIVVGTL